MKPAFGDTSYFRARFDPADDLHAAATAASASNPFLVTSQFVLTELLNAFWKAPPHIRMEVGRFCQGIELSTQVVVVPCSASLFADGLAHYLDRPDKNWSLTDCTSFLIMRELGLTAALTADKHFSQAGFQVLLKK